MQGISEEELITYCIQGNSVAQRYLYDLYSKKLYGVALRYASSDEEAQDIIQDSFVKIYLKLDTFKFEGSFEGWMRRITTHTAIEYYRKRVNFQKVDSSYHEDIVVIPQETNLEAEELLAMIQSLSDGYRMVFNLFAIEGYSHAEIAKKLNISEGTSKSQLSRARQHLQVLLQKKSQIKRPFIQPILAILRLISIT